MFVDSHAHLSMPAFDDDLPAVLARARAAGVGRFMTCATSLADAGRNVAIARQHGLRASVGFHPHQAKDWGEDSAAELLRLIAAFPEIAAIGEVGLDYHYNYSPPEVQRDVLRRQVGLARETGLPLVVHCRNARDDIRRIFLEEKAHETGGVLHCFSEDAEFARFCVDTGFHVSFSGILTFKKAEEIREAAKVVPLERLLVETDAPFLAPVPYRGRRNEPAHVVDVTKALADLRGIGAEELAELTAAAFERLFTKKAPG